MNSFGSFGEFIFYTKKLSLVSHKFSLYLVRELVVWWNEVSLRFDTANYCSSGFHDK
jgi:hypothetical protein